ncbi:hypothetical protein LCGC14_2547620, partial [marine sediment metagenome]
MGIARNKFDKRLLGRVPDCGRVSFKTGASLTRKDRLKNRNSRLAREILRRQLS